jgi:hypothetical protein
MFLRNGGNHRHNTMQSNKNEIFATELTCLIRCTGSVYLERSSAAAGVCRRENRMIERELEVSSQNSLHGVVSKHWRRLYPDVRPVVYSVVVLTSPCKAFYISEQLLPLLKT